MFPPIAIVKLLYAWEWCRTRRLNSIVGIRPVRNLFLIANRLGDRVYQRWAILALVATHGRPGLGIALRILAAGTIGFVLYKLLK